MAKLKANKRLVRAAIFWNAMFPGPCSLVDVSADQPGLLMAIV